MYPNYYRNIYPKNYRSNNRFVGGFAVPFLLGGIAGAAWNNRPMYYYPPYPIYYNNYYSYPYY